MVRSGKPADATRAKHMSRKLTAAQHAELIKRYMTGQLVTSNCPIETVLEDGFTVRFPGMDVFHYHLDHVGKNYFGPSMVLGELFFAYQEPFCPVCNTL